jgi:hypothetical protein
MCYELENIATGSICPQSLLNRAQHFPLSKMSTGLAAFVPRVPAQ